MNLEKLNINKFNNLSKSILLFKRQINDFRSHGLSIVPKKIKRCLILLIDTILTLCSVPLILTVRLIKPIIWIRFGPIRSDVIGHFVNDTAYYLAKKSKENLRKIDFFYLFDNNANLKFKKKYPNSQWNKMIKRKMFIHPLVKYVHYCNKLFFNYKIHYVESGSGLGSHDPEGMLVNFKTDIKFTSEENKKGHNFLKQIGLKSTDRFVCFNVRDNAYKNKYHNFHNWDYTNHKNSDIDTYKDAASALVEKGYWVFRMGKEVEKNFNMTHPNIIDYAKNSFKSDFLDIWLNANCYFSVSTPSGLAEICKVFFRPMVFVNFIPLSDCQYSKKTYILPKKLKWKINNKFLSMKELIETGTIDLTSNSQYEEKGIEVVDNSSEDIKEAVLEIEARLNNKWIDNKTDENLQDTFHRKFKTMSNYKRYFKGANEPILTTDFLRKNHEWFLRER